MALDFPANPTNGQVYGSYVYNSTVGAWQAREDSATVATISTTLPASANPGDIWYDNDDGTSYVYYDDGTSAQWVELLSSGLPLLNTKADLADPTFTNNVTITNDLNVNGTDINGDGKTIARFSDSWLRLNPDQDFSAGIYTNNSLIRTDNGLQVGANGTNFLATTSALTHNGTDILKKDMRQYYTVGAVGTGTAANYYEVFTWTVSGQYNNFSAQLQINGRGNTDPRYVVHARGEYGVSTWGTEVLTISSDHALPDGDTWLLVFSDASKTAKLYYRRTGSDWNDRTLNFNAHWVGSATPVYSNTNFGTTAPTGDAVITKSAPDSIALVSGGTGATTLSGAQANLQIPLSQNYLINGGFDIWQKGDTVSQSSKCGSDQWYFYYYGAMSQIRVTSGVPVNSENAMRVRSDSNGNLSVGVMNVLETKNARQLWGKQVTFSVKVRRASTMVRDLTLLVYKHGTVDQSPSSGTWTNISSVAVPNASIPTGTTSSDWYRASITVTIPSDGTANTLWFEVRAQGGMDNGVYYEIAEAQVEHGSAPTTFRRNSPSIQAEFAACQRYYWRFTQENNYYMFNSATCWAAGGEMIVNIPLPVTQRVTGTQAMTNVSSIYWLGNGTNLSGATGASYRPTKEAFVLVCTVPSQTSTNTWAFRPYVGSYMESNAEL